MALPKLDMGTVKDSEEKEKKTLRESMRQLSRKASASLRRGLTPRGSRAERKDSFDSLEDAAAHEDALAGALGLQSSQVSTSGSESLPPASQLLSAPPLVEPPRPEHERLPQFEPAESTFNAAQDEASELSKEQLPEPVDDDSEQQAFEPADKKAADGGGQAPRHSIKAASADDSDLRRPPAGKPPMPLRSASGSGVDVYNNRVTSPVLGQSAAARAEVRRCHCHCQYPGDPAPHVEAPPKGRPDLPQFEDASDEAAVTAAKASAWKPDRSENPEPVPAGAAAAEPTGDAQEEAAAMVQDPPSKPQEGRPKWQEVALAMSVFAIGIIASEPALAAWRRRRQPPPPPVVDAKAAKRRGGWGFS